jgi:hypothetical protein
MAEISRVQRQWQQGLTICDLNKSNIYKKQNIAEQFVWRTL